MKKVNFTARLVFWTGICCFGIGLIIAIISASYISSFGYLIDSISSGFLQFMFVVSPFALIGIILLGLSEMIEQQSLTNQLLAKSSGIDVRAYHEELYLTYVKEKEALIEKHRHKPAVETPAPAIGYQVTTNRFDDVNWYIKDTDVNWVCDSIGQLGEKVQTITAIPWHYYFVAETKNNKHLVKIDRDLTNTAEVLDWNDNPKILTWWETYETKKNQ
ncbi:hypothetical protein [Alkalicoccobacillus murimartini]|uniref:Uncharacterized protein n=1 Tax=Alkalicoccobacillus murimartini TaxID=171685 RepID=A0ABT9YG51_9BACI|nr:hypothetical protein [Alkalicoccobacillus murimartini]MDQ0206841.1 hypothetical protein [Alkalicoccobacillus murimartini]